MSNKQNKTYRYLVVVKPITDNLLTKDIILNTLNNELLAYYKNTLESNEDASVELLTISRGVVFTEDSVRALYAEVAAYLEMHDPKEYRRFITSMTDGISYINVYESSIKLDGIENVKKNVRQLLEETYDSDNRFIHVSDDDLRGSYEISVIMNEIKLGRLKPVTFNTTSNDKTNLN